MQVYLILIQEEQVLANIEFDTSFATASSIKLFFFRVGVRAEVVRAAVTFKGCFAKQPSVTIVETEILLLVLVEVFGIELALPLRGLLFHVLFAGLAVSSIPNFLRNFLHPLQNRLVMVRIISAGPAISPLKCVEANWPRPPTFCAPQHNPKRYGHGVPALRKRCISLESSPSLGKKPEFAPHPSRSMGRLRLLACTSSPVRSVSLGFVLCPAPSRSTFLLHGDWHSSAASNAITGSFLESSGPVWTFSPALPALPQPRKSRLFSARFSEQSPSPG